MFIEEVKTIVVNKEMAEEKLIAKIKDSIKLWASWGHDEGSFSTTGLAYDFLYAGLTETARPSFSDMMDGVNLIERVLVKEGFQVEMKCYNKEIMVIVRWGAN